MLNTEELIKRYDIVQECKFVKGDYVYGERLFLHNMALAERDGAIPELKERKQEILDYIKAKREEEKRAYEERKAKIASIPGLKEIEKAKADLERWEDEFAKSFEDVGGLGVRPRPDIDLPALYEKYPIAKAYLVAESYALKTNYELAAIGKKAQDRIIENHSDYEAAMADMEKELQEFTAKHMWD